MKIKKILKTTRKEFFYGGHTTSLGSVSVILTSIIILDIKITFDFLIIVYLWTHATYLFNRLKELKQDYPINQKKVQYLRKKGEVAWIITCIFILFPFLLMIILDKKSALYFGTSLLLLSTLYSVVLKKITRKLFAFKTFLVPMIWSLLIVFLCFYYNLSITWQIVFIIIFIYLRLFIHEEILNIRDIKSDTSEKLLTLATTVGKKKTIKLLGVINFLTIVPILLGIFLKILPNYSIALLIIVFYSFYFLKKLKGVHNFSYDLITDGELLLWPAIILISKIIVKV